MKRNLLIAAVVLAVVALLGGCATSKDAISQAEKGEKAKARFAETRGITFPAGQYPPVNASGQ